MGFGGPVWHASVAIPGLAMLYSVNLRTMAFEILNGVGDAKAGQWFEDRPKAFHIRRRLTPEEQERVGEAVDIRGTPEETQRFQHLLAALPEQVRQIVVNQIARYK
jgi:hypothetical protein